MPPPSIALGDAPVAGVVGVTVAGMVGVTVAGVVGVTVAGVVGVTVAGVVGNAYTTAPSGWPGSQRGRRGVGATVALACPAVACRLPGVAAASGVAVGDAGL
jgi:hypothetical protein